MPRIFMSAGEPSGMNIAVSLMRTLKSRMDDIEFVGLGGQEMVDEGMRQIWDPTVTAAMWLWGNLKRIPAHRKALNDSIAEWERERPDLVITVDYQAFHLYLGSAARERGIPVLHCVSSQFWARRFYTLEPIRRAYDHVLCIHEFEKPHYDRAGIDATFIGHPLFERLPRRELDAQRIESFRALRPPRIGLLPGSRLGEIRNNLPVMLDAARRLAEQPHLVVSCGRPGSEELIRELVDAQELEAEVVRFSTGEILTACDAAMITSGTASMEAVYYGCPCVILYRVDLINYYFAKPHIASLIGQPNLIAGKQIAPEFLMASRSGRRVGAALRRVLADPSEQLEAFRQIRARLLDGPTASERAADVVQSMLSREES